MSINSIHTRFSRGTLSFNTLEDGSGILLDADGERLLSLNATGMLVLQAIAGGRGDDDIAGELCDRFEVSREQALADVRDLAGKVDKALGR